MTIIDDLNERCNVAWLQFKRAVILPSNLNETMTENFRLGFVAGYKIAMMQAIKMSLGLEPTIPE